VHRIDRPELSEIYERKLVLVRPDGHVAWRADEPPEDPLALFARVTGQAAVTAMPETVEAAT
jgi:hypothetical protein